MVGEGRAGELRNLALLVGAVVFLDTMFYAVIAPLLPQLTNQLHLSKLSAGVLTAAYPAGTLLAALQRAARPRRPRQIEGDGATFGS